ncbi:MAG: hypothetical protein ACLP3K_00925 [Candidatus Acidiferrales bacterium]
MKKFAGLFALLLLVVVPVVAQDAPSQDTPPQDTSQSSSSSSSQTTPEENQKPEKKVSTLFSPKYEISAGYSHRSFYTSGLPKVGMNGWYGSFTYDWKSWLAGEAEVQGVYKTIPVTEGGTENPSLYTLLAGPQIYPFKHHKFSPFGHFLYGEGYYRLAIGPYDPFGSSLTTYFSHAWEGGGGLDVHIKPHWSVRGMFDYGSTHFHSVSGGSTTGQGSYRFAAGIVYYIGER